MDDRGDLCDNGRRDRRGHLALAGEAAVVGWRDEVLDPATMSEADIRAELRHDLSVYDQVQHPLSKAAMGARITVLTKEMDERVARGEVKA